MDYIYELEELKPNSDTEIESISLLKQSLMKQYNELCLVKDQITTYQKMISKNTSGYITDENTNKTQDGFKWDNLPKWIEPKTTQTVESNKDNLTKSKSNLDLEKNIDYNQNIKSDQNNTNDLSDNRMKTLLLFNYRLFNEVKEKIFNEATNVIFAHENDPYFVLQAFRMMEKMNTPYLRQKFLFSLESLVDTKERTKTECVEDVDSKEPVSDGNRIIVDNEIVSESVSDKVSNKTQEFDINVDVPEVDNSISNQDVPQVFTILLESFKVNILLNNNNNNYIGKYIFVYYQKFRKELL